MDREVRRQVVHALAECSPVRRAKIAARLMECVMCIQSGGVGRKIPIENTNEAAEALCDALQTLFDSYVPQMRAEDAGDVFTRALARGFHHEGE